MGKKNALHNQRMLPMTSAVSDRSCEQSFAKEHPGSEDDHDHDHDNDDDGDYDDLEEDDEENEGQEHDEQVSDTRSIICFVCRTTFLAANEA